MTVRYRIVKHERTKPKTASVRAHHGQVMSFERLCERTSERIRLASPDVVRMIVQAALDEAYDVAHGYGYRVDLGEKRLSLYVQVSKSVAAHEDPETGETVWPTNTEMTPRRDNASLQCEVHKSWNKRLRKEVTFELTDDERHVIRER